MVNSFPAKATTIAKSCKATISTSCIPQREVSVFHNRAEDTFTLYGQSFASRLLLGTARYESPLQLADAIRAADPALLTVSVRRQFSSGRLSSQHQGQTFWALLRETGRNILPNTAG